MRRPLIAGNWKMHGTQAEAVDLAASIRRLVDGAEGVDILVCPPFTSLATVRGALDGSRVALGAQDMHWEAKGAFTGEVSGPMLREFGVTHVVLGHSERRHVMGETNDMVRRKVGAALTHNLTPIICVGELLEERSMGVTREVVERQVTKAIEGLVPDHVARVIFAYEPVWAIGTGKNATPAQAQEVHHFIRNLTARLSATAVAEAVRILYGGSVKPENARELMTQPDVDGALVGGASLEARSFARIVRFRESA